MYVERKFPSASSHEMMMRGGEGPGTQKAVVPFRGGRIVVVVVVLKRMRTGPVSGLARVVVRRRKGGGLWGRGR